MVVTRARPDAALRTITSLLACRPSPAEVIVVETGPRTVAVAHAAGRQSGANVPIRCIDAPAAGIASGRNAGLRLASSEVVAFTDDDVEVDEAWIGSISEAFASEIDVGCVTGLVLPAGAPGQFKPGPPRRVHRLSRPSSPLFPFAAREFGSGANTALRVELARSLQGFDEILGAGTPARGGDDLDMYIRVLLAGYALIYEPAAIVRQRPSEGRGERQRRGFDERLGLAATLTKYLVSGYGSTLMRRAPTIARYVSSPDVRGGASSQAWIEQLGVLLGPLAYLRSQRRQRVAGQPLIKLSEIPYLPAWVGELDLANPSSVPAPGAEYKRAWLLVRRGATPVACAEITLGDGSISGPELRARALRVVNGAARTSIGRPPASEQLERPPTITVVVCTRDRAPSLRRTLESILALDYDHLERVVVVDNAPASTATSELVGDFADPRIDYVLEPVAGLSRARNRGVSRCSSEIVAFTDDDVVVDRGWLQGIARGFSRSPQVACVTGLILPASLDTVEQAYFEAKVKWSLKIEPRLFDLAQHRGARALFPYTAGDFGAGANFAVRTGEMARLGGFDEALGAGTASGGGEDLDFFLRVVLAGHALAYEPSAFVWHEHRREREALRRQMYAYRSSLVAYANKHVLTPPALRVIFATALGRRAVHSPQPLRPPAPMIPGLLGVQLAGAAAGTIAYARARARPRRRPPPIGVNRPELTQPTVRAELTHRA